MTKNIHYAENGYSWMVSDEESIQGFDYFYGGISESNAIKLRLKCESIEGKVHVGQIEKLLK